MIALKALELGMTYQDFETLSIKMLFKIINAKIDEIGHQTASREQGSVSDTQSKSEILSFFGV